MSIYECSLNQPGCNVHDSIMVYRPSLAANACFLVFFGISAVAHVAQGIITRKTAFWIAMALGCVSEIIGYVGRMLSWHNPWSMTGFLVQICCIGIAPAFFAAAIYFCLRDIVEHVSVDASRLKPSTYWKIFIPCDVVSLCLQGAGGGLASVASQQNEDPATGTHIMVAGLSFQVASMSLFILLTIEFFWRVRKLQKESALPLMMGTSKQRLQVFLSFFSLAILTIYIRCVYRVAELSEGWTGHLYTTQRYFIVLEGVMILIAVYALHVGHPALLGPGTTSEKDEPLAVEEGTIAKD